MQASRDTYPSEADALAAAYKLLDGAVAAAPSQLHTCVYAAIAGTLPVYFVAYYMRPFPRVDGYRLIAAFAGIHSDVIAV